VSSCIQPMFARSAVRSIQHPKLVIVPPEYFY
jgi:hypothetical protein